MNKVNFYPDIKPHFSPSAFNSWHTSNSSFIKTYFMNEKTPETKRMKAGKKIHALVEGGLLEVEKVFKNNEVEISTELDGYKLFGIPDSDSCGDSNNVEFVDYKTGEINSWNREKLARDLKMRFTAFLVWVKASKPSQVKGYIEWIGTTVNEETGEIEPTGESAVVEYIYRSAELEEFGDIILETINTINEAYNQFLESSDVFINKDDCKEYAELEKQKKEIDKKQKVIKERIIEQIVSGGKKSFASPYGSFSVSDRKTYEYPDDLEFTTESGNTMTFALGDEVISAMKTAQKNYELSHEPKSITKSMRFTAN